ncbi:acetyl/propionyl/methylcrotonyl-CoA carboxylase subunit alpha [Limoniibacter endophyticus]|uniref:3-methylcrotonyl-CoA carboxylase subunit alpha n=1 Tax=Limoniibacter endophyticus TaxID=1565040 RepID=A0A8J3DRC2_9HYPH|nr:acetyl/propionyl/methylcrotonyl-CoA carboxylase subunit alpha [Limoniibacter endophyticus]GHC69179.1 3-methylcrotonyl-CoA carboxylase subunit alpha [Limoniibacter endophyticus]
MFSRILIANRGEIACRIIRTARRLGISTVAVYSDADMQAKHVREADEAVHIGAAPASESYLDIARIIAAAKEKGAQAIHPGYGFLSENARFVEAVEAAGLIFIGPSAQSIRAMGLKDAAKALMEKAGVPVVPGYHGEAQNFVLLAGKANDIGYPILIKARAGGGGKGMRRVDHPDHLEEALAAARREAKSSFGDEGVLIEKLIEKPRHIEVQVFGDGHGNVVHLFERDCSAQRRHQKVIEEAPAPGMTTEMREAMTQAAIKAAKAVDYRGAGTIEFIVDASEGLRPDRFWFMEMNTRLQVEHPVTEMVTGHDLVEWQLRVANNEPLPVKQDEIGLNGHAFEARLYAEDAARDFLPAIGRLHHLRFPQGAEIRIDSGIDQGDAISPFYDPMIAKLITHGRDRAQSLAALTHALEATQIAGTVTNLRFLAALSKDTDFRSGDVDTGLIERKRQALTATHEPEFLDFAKAALAASGARPQASGDPWEALPGYSHFTPVIHKAALGFADDTLEFTIRARGNGSFDIGSEFDTQTARLSPDAIASDVTHWPGHVTVFGRKGSYEFTLASSAVEADDQSAGNVVRAPMPGLVKIVFRQAGESVAKGDALLVLEAMKMEHTIKAPRDGVLEDIAEHNAQVSDGVVLVRFAAA